jgi:hypothetical protein
MTTFVGFVFVALFTFALPVSHKHFGDKMQMRKASLMPK